MKIIKKIIKRIILSCFMLYCYNYIAVKFNLVIPINVINIMLVSILGPCGLCGLVFFKYFILWGSYG